MNYTYLLINIFVLLGPLALSFDKRVAFHKNWKELFPAILVMAAIFIPWDVVFTHYGVWGFNPDYLSGLYLFKLPIEEWLFFITVPYACIFIYACLRSYVVYDLIGQRVYLLVNILGVGLIILGAISFLRWYTSVTFLVTGIYLLVMGIRVKPYFLGRFVMAYLVSLLPFLLVNGVLTGSELDAPIVWYNPDHILGMRIFTIPLEDTMYNLLMLLTTVHVYEFLKAKKEGIPYY